VLLRKQKHIFFTVFCTGGNIMLVLEGKSVFAGIAIGPVILYKRMVHTVAGHVVANPESEVAQFSRRPFDRPKSN
jgi:hypothetical protein